MQADPWGVSFGYTDGEGAFRAPDPLVRRAIHRAIGAPDDGSGQPQPSGSVEVLLPGDAFEASAATEIRHENGSTITLSPGFSIDRHRMVPRYWVPA